MNEDWTKSRSTASVDMGGNNKIERKREEKCQSGFGWYKIVPGADPFLQDYRFSRVVDFKEGRFGLLRENHNQPNLNYKGEVSPCTHA